MITLSDVELRHLIVHAQLKRARIKHNVKEILTNEFGDYYNGAKEDDFFLKYAGKIVTIYPDNKFDDCTDWFILEEDNHVLTHECIEILDCQ